MSKKQGRENDTIEVLNEVKKSEVAEREEAILRFWEAEDIFNKSVALPAGAEPKGDFIFYDGPPFATGLPHYGHLLAGTIKDAVPRFWTMNGYRVERKWGWDCHGLPVENLIEKKLGLGTKKDIEDYGVQNFNEQARDSVLEYADVWREVIPRMGRFVDMKNDYRTMDSSYTESVWWVFKSLHEKGLVFEGFKSMHLCPRCGTTLSNFEVNLGYKDIKDIAVTVKLPLLDEVGKPTDTSLLVWTTTPWTLPGNMAAAINEEVDYVTVDVTGEKLILAKGRLAQLGEVEFKELDTYKGSALIGRKYQPPFDYIQKQNIEGAEKAWTIYHADFVELGEEGTGGVHIAPAYGDDDMKLAQANDIPIYHHVDEGGHFKDFVTDFAGRLVKPKDDEGAGVDHKDSDIEILRALQAKGVIFKKENISHSYPHCWRCETPLINYATTSWFVDVPSIKDKIIAENDKVNWVPDYVGSNRFGKWLEGARDWAVSRQRYWGAPIPIWKNPTTGDWNVMGSLADIQEYIPKSGNQYLVMRHGESLSNVEHFLNGEIGLENPLTAKGREQVAVAIENLPQDLDYIFYSPLQRTKETAKQVAEALGLKPEQLIEEDRIRECRVGDLEGKSNSAKESLFETPEAEFIKKNPGVETLNEVKQRMGDFIYEIDAKYRNKKILIISHGDPLCMLEAAVKGLDTKGALKLFDDYYQNAQVRELVFIPIPHNENYELDFHRPYIDEIDLFEGETKLVRVPDVFDCWFESGSMPYAQIHYPFANKSAFETKGFPAQFIAEGLDQTRGWFYSMIVLGTALFGKSPFENVIVNGLVLAEDGKKMSKSLKNYPDPIELVNETGADAVRFYMMSSPIMRAEDLNFSAKEVLELQRKNIGRLHNVLAMYEMFADGTKASDTSHHILDKWILARLNQLIAEVTTGYKNYELDKAARPVTDFIDDLSVWYLRRSRDRIKGDDLEDKKHTLATLRYVLKTLALVMAPAMPFYADYLWRVVKEEGEAESVHLAAWPETLTIDPVVIGEMSLVREFVTLALEARTKSDIKVRQPLKSLTLNIEMGEEFTAVIADEINVKEVLFDLNLPERIKLDTQLNSELVAEGAVRELMRAIQGKRKVENLEPQDVIELSIKTNDLGQTALQAEANYHLLMKTVGAQTINFGETEGESVSAGDYNFIFAIKKV